MRIAWFSPVAPDRTDIANYTQRLIQPLSNHFQLEIFTSQPNPNLGAWEIPVHVIRDGEVDWKHLNQFDAVIYHIGNNRLFHREIWDISQRRPGFVVLHDEVLQHFFAGIFKDAQDEESYLGYMETFYGNEGRIAGKQFWDGLRTIDSLAPKYPLTELALIKSMGVIVHTKSAFEKIKELNTNPVIHLHLPYSSQVYATRKAIGSSKPYQLVVFGFIGTNRRLESILHALASFPQKDQFKLSIMGELWDKDYIVHLIRELGLGKHVEVLGYVREEELNQRLAEADLAFNFRYPTMGEASGSQLRIWDHALPSLVTNVGWYAELPNDAVYKISIENEKEDIHRCLQLFMEHPERFREMGMKGKKYLLENHSPEKYVKGIAMFLNECHQRVPSYLSQYIINRFFYAIEGFVDHFNPSILTSSVNAIEEILSNTTEKR